MDLFFDIDGTINDYSDQVKPALACGEFQRVLQNAGVDRIICVSSWVSIYGELPA